MLVKVMLVKILRLKCYWDKYTVLNVLLLAKAIETRKTANKVIKRKEIINNKSRKEIKY